MDLPLAEQRLVPGLMRLRSLVLVRRYVAEAIGQIGRVATDARGPGRKVDKKNDRERQEKNLPARFSADLFLLERSFHGKLIINGSGDGFK